MSAYVLEPTWPQALEELRDVAVDKDIQESETIHSGAVWDLRADIVDLGNGHTVRREFVVHTGAVSVVAMDDHDRVLLIRQYRHPVGMMLWELVAGLLDVNDEDPRDAAARELVEEAGLTAREWHTLVDFETSPGGSSEVIRMYVARGLAPVPGGRPAGEAEELDLPLVWMPLDLLVAKVLAGDFTCPTTVTGALAAFAARQSGWSSLRPAGAPWPMRQQVVNTGRVRR
jgi:ADP-ribose pyrophosphatase